MEESKNIIIDNGDSMAPPTLFLDLDGTIVKFPHTHEDYNKLARGEQDMELCPGVREKLWEWESKGYKIIITTGRREMYRFETERALKKAAIGYEQLIMGIGCGPRYVINDRKPGIKNGKKDTAFAINIDRDEGFENIDI
jgi:hypothetical protein